MLTFASLALPFHSRQRRRSTSSTITAFAAARSGPSDDRPPAICVRCCSRMATWNQSRIGSPSTPASRRMRRSPGQPSVNAVSAVPSVRPTASRLRRIRPARSVSVFATAPKTCRPSARRLDIADPDLQVPLAVLATPDEGRIQGHHDRLGAGRRRLHRHLRWQRLGDLEGVAAQGLRIRAGVHREHLPQHLGGRPVGHQGGELRPQPIQLRGRADMRRPSHACLGHAASSTAEAGQPDGDLAEQRGDRVLTIVLDPAGRRHSRGTPDGARRGRRACAATISCWTPARSCLPSARVRPRVARSVRSSGRAIRMTSVLRSSPSAPMLTSFTIQATLSLPHRE